MGRRAHQLGWPAWAQLIRDYTDIPPEAERVIFFPARPAEEAVAVLFALALALIALVLAAPLIANALEEVAPA